MAERAFGFSGEEQPYNLAVLLARSLHHRWNVTIGTKSCFCNTAHKLICAVRDFRQMKPVHFSKDANQL